MNELIEKLWEKFSNEGNTMEILDFEQAIQIACKAQRNACARVYEDYGEADEIGYNKSKIKSAEITKEDYE